MGIIAPERRTFTVIKGFGRVLAILGYLFGVLGGLYFASTLVDMFNYGVPFASVVPGFVVLVTGILLIGFGEIATVLFTIERNVRATAEIQYAWYQAQAVPEPTSADTGTSTQGAPTSPAPPTPPASN